MRRHVLILAAAASLHAQEAAPQRDGTEFGFATFINTNELDEIQSFLDESMKASCEGLMVKMLDGAESGYEPSKRSRNWLKVSNLCICPIA